MFAVASNIELSEDGGSDLDCSGIQLPPHGWGGSEISRKTSPPWERGWGGSFPLHGRGAGGEVFSTSPPSWGGSWENFGISVLVKPDFPLKMVFFEGKTTEKG